MIAVLMICPGRAWAQGNLFETLQGPQDEGVSGQEQPAADPVSDPEPEPEPAPAPEPEDTSVDEDPTSSEPPRIMAQQTLESLISEIIRNILSQMGGKLPPGTRIVVILPPGTCPNSPVTTTKPPTTTTPPVTTTPPTTTKPTPTPTTPTTTGPVPATAEEKRAFSQKYGTQLVDGDSAWSKGQLGAADEVFARLPGFFRSTTKDIKRERMFRNPYTGQVSQGVLGYVRSDIPNRVHMMDLAATAGNLAMAKSQFQGTLVHEMTHTFQNMHPDITQAWNRQFWSSGRPNPPSVSGYGNTQMVEDMAESVRTYFQAGARMKSVQPARYEFIRKYVMQGKVF
jgi:hypothetical protein